MSISSVMATIPIASQTSMASIFGQNSCHVFWITSVTYSMKMVTSGTGMAAYRLVCFNNMFKRHLDRKKMVKKILLAEFLVIIGMISMNSYGYSTFGWEKAFLHQYCMNDGTEKVETLHNYKIDHYNDQLYKSLRFIPNAIIQALMLVEMAIYLWLIFKLWKQDRDNFKLKIITEDVRRERNTKNIITLKGQMISFAIEFAYGICVVLLSNNVSFSDPSLMILIKIVGSTVISVVQLMSSHEMKRFIRQRFNMF